MKDNLGASFDDFFNDDEETIEEFSLPDLNGLDRLSSGEDQFIALPEDSSSDDDLFNDVLNDDEKEISAQEEEKKEIQEELESDSIEDALLTMQKEEEKKETMISSFDCQEDERDYYEYYEDQENEDPMEGFDLDTVLADAIEKEASDVHVVPNQPVRFTIVGDIIPQPQYVPNGNVIMRVMQNIVSSVLESDFIENLELDASYVMKKDGYKGRRMRLSVGKSFGEIFMVFRIINDDVPTPDVLGVSDELLGWTDLPNGLLMMNGPTGTGKALRIDTLIPLANGETVPIGDIRVGDVIKDRNGHDATVEWISPIDTAPKLYRITTAEGKVIYPDANHKFFVNIDKTFINEKPNHIRNFMKIVNKKDTIDLKTVASLVNFIQGEEIDTESVLRGAFFLDEKISLFLALELVADYLDRRYERYRNEIVMHTFDIVKLFQKGASIAIPTSCGIYDTIKNIETVAKDDTDYAPVRCLSVSSPDESFLLHNGIVTHNSTTLASMLRRIQLERPQKIITLERPIEFVYPDNGKALVVQREIGKDARSFSKALDSAMRQAPNIIMVGEVRNRDEVNELLRAAETGHLTISTMHTNSAAATINRIKSLYEGDDQLRVLASLSDVARGFANQVLVKTLDGKGRFAVREVLSIDKEISKLILKGDVEAIRNIQIKRGLTMEHELVKAIKDGKCTINAARSQSSYPALFDELLRKEGLDRFSTNTRMRRI